MIIPLMSSCEEVIEVDLEDAAPKLVIEGHISNTKGPFNIYISQATDFFSEPGTYLVEVESVTISTTAGAIEKLKNIVDGHYRTSSIEGVPGEAYTITVVREGTKITTTSMMPHPVRINNLHYVYDDTGFNLSGEPGYEISCFFDDPVGAENYYRLLIYRNGELLDDKGFYLFDDKFSDGNEISYTFFDQRFDFQDNVKVELRSLDEQTYRYYEQLNEIVSDFDFSSAAPANPTSVYSEDVLGVFSAYSRYTMEFAIIIE